MNIALTGASGFIGSAVAKLAAKHGHAVKALVRETSKREHMLETMTTKTQLHCY
jgi:uncharacterized protein YbjT (DUF2867 family)